MATIEDAGDGGATRSRRVRRIPGGLVTIGTVSALLAAMGLTVLGLGAADNAAANYDASSWLWSSARSEMARVNGVTARVDTRVEIPGARRHSMQVVQTDKQLILRDLDTGQVSSLNLATLQIMATTRTTPGLGVSVALDGDAAFVVDAVQGVVRQLDPRSLVPVGEPVRYPPGITGGVFDGAGRLWVGVPSEGTVSAVTAADLPESPGPSGAGLSPKQVATYDVADGHHELVLSTLDDGVAVLDRTRGDLVAVRGGVVTRTPLGLTGVGHLPPRTTGARIPVTVPGERQVHVVDGERVRTFTVPGRGDRLSPTVAWADRFYTADEATRTIYSFDASGQVVDTIRGGKGLAGPLELEVRENHLFINAPQSARARVVNDRHEVRDVDKYASDVLGADPPQEPPPPPPPPPKPKVSAPGPPRDVTAAAGDGRARVTWRPAAANGAQIMRYVVEGAGQRQEVGANQRAVEVTGLTNGEEYRFSVHAVNAKGEGPARRTNPVTPTADVPDAPESVTASERPDGTVVVTWPEADGQGNTVARYAVTATSAGANAPVGEATGTELVVRAGELEYGTQYAFTVVAVTQAGAGSTASPVSNTVVPFAVPGAPGDLSAATVADRPGTVSVRWSEAVANGRPVTAYRVEVGGRRSEVTDTRATVEGLGDGQDVTVSVTAVNEAGEGPAVTGSARTVAAPRVTVTGASATATSVTVSVTVDAGGGEATCSVGTPGEPTVSGSCSRLTVPNLAPGTAYPLTVTARNAAGEGTATRRVSTEAMFGVATCVNGASGDEATYCDRDRDGRNGNEIFSVPRQDNDRQVGWAKPGRRLEAYCKRRGEEVYAYIYNDEKRSTWWVQVEFEGKNYIPWAWLNLEGGDEITSLPTC
ncbi:fibronectin type III domain-containing protein [Micromonospora sp. SH-82]|uniref:fibronectin type III domain-containing protein n=1 Tax=Micromonospora sp. SH-82 TaxID=3132938 RepID=UPI003EBBA1C9